MLTRVKQFAVKFGSDDAGVTLLEYTILLSIITVGAITTIGLVGGKVSTAWNTFNTNMPAGT